MAFAEGTTVPVEKTRGEIEALVRKYGATRFTSGWDGTQAGLAFVVRDRQVKFVVPLPDQQDKKLRAKAAGMRGWLATNLPKVVEAEERRRWRCLLLAIKAKLEIVSSGIATFEEEFLAHIVTDNGQTVFERISGDTATSARMLPVPMADIDTKGEVERPREALRRIVANPCLSVGGGECRPNCNHANHVAERALSEPPPPEPQMAPLCATCGFPSYDLAHDATNMHRHDFISRDVQPAEPLPPVEPEAPKPVCAHDGCYIATPHDHGASTTGPGPAAPSPTSR
jgi:hypothetical protein